MASRWTGWTGRGGASTCLIWKRTVGSSPALRTASHPSLPGSAGWWCHRLRSSGVWGCCPPCGGRWSWPGAFCSCWDRTSWMWSGTECPRRDSLGLPIAEDENTLDVHLDGILLLLLFSDFHCHLHADSRSRAFWIAGCSYLSCDPATWLAVWALGWTCWLVDWSVLWAAAREEAPEAGNCSEERTRCRMSAHNWNSTQSWPFVVSHRANTVVKAARTSARCWGHLIVNVEDPRLIFFNDFAGDCKQRAKYSVGPTTIAAAS